MSSMKEIFVNAQSFFTPDSRASYAYIVTLAGMRGDDLLRGGVLTVTYDPAYAFGGQAGTLQPGQSVKITNGMHFDCVRTGAA